MTLLKDYDWNLRFDGKTVERINLNDNEVREWLKKHLTEIITKEE